MLSAFQREPPMSRVLCYTIGRDAAAAITVPHATVSRLHAEVIPLPDGRVYITDCASTNGTFIREDGHWHRISQDFADAGSRVRFGQVEMTVSRLLAEIVRLQGTGTANGPPTGQPGVRQAEKLDASLGVVRNPETGEPVALADKPD